MPESREALPSSEATRDHRAGVASFAYFLEESFYPLGLSPGPAAQRNAECGHRHRVERCPRGRDTASGECRDAQFMGAGGRPLRRAFINNGKPPTTDWLGGGENIRAKDYMCFIRFRAVFGGDGAGRLRSSSPTSVGRHRARRPMAASTVDAVGSVPSEIQKDRARAAPAVAGVGLLR